MKKIIFILCCFMGMSLLQYAQAQTTATRHRYLREVQLSGSGYELGLQHGRELKKEIGEIVAIWKKNVESQLKKPADDVVQEFFAYARFDETIRQWTPELYEEVRGIADGSGQAFNDIMVHNLLDEFWVWQDARRQHHCSGIGVPARDGKPGYIAQNMDLESYPDGYQTLLHLARTDKTPEQLILTYPGLIALNGLNEAGIGACMNTLMQLKATPAGLPVAFVVRRILSSTDKDDVLHFIQTAPHASGQNYIIGIQGEVYDFEASCNKVVRFDPQNANGTVYHTNHPVANDDLKDWHKDPAKGNSAARFASVQTRMAALPGINDTDIKAALRAKDDPKHPVCCTFNQWGGTFGSVVMTLTGNPKLQITAGPPDESEYKEVRFSTGKTLPGEEGWRTITGSVVSMENEPLVGVMAMFNQNDGTFKSEITDMEGRYAIAVPLSCRKLRVGSYEGFPTPEITLGPSDTVNVILVPVYPYGKLSEQYIVQRNRPTRVVGTIKGEKGANYFVRITGTDTMAYPDKNGDFALTVPPENDMLSIESDKHPAQKVLLGNQDTVTISIEFWKEPVARKKWWKFRKN